MTAKDRNRIAEISVVLQELRDNEEAKLSNMPESLQASERGERMQEVVDALDGAISELEQITAS